MKLSCKVLMGFRTCCPQIRLFGILNNLSWKVWENSRSKKVPLISPYTCPSFLKAGDKFTMWKLPSLNQEESDILIARENLGPRRLYKQNLFLSHHLLLLAQNPLSHQFFTNLLFLCLRYKSFLFWSLLQVFILMWRLPHTHKNLINCVCFSPINLPLSVSFLDPYRD